ATQPCRPQRHLSRPSTGSCSPPLVHLPSLHFFVRGARPPESSTLSLHDALPISRPGRNLPKLLSMLARAKLGAGQPPREAIELRSEEHTSELQSPCNLVCRPLLEKKNRSPACASPLAHSATSAALARC